jgi:hypothetical protein
MIDQQPAVVVFFFLTYFRATRLPVARWSAALYAFVCSLVFLLLVTLMVRMVAL